MKPGDHVVADTVLEVRDLRVHFPLDEGLLKAVDGVDFDVTKGRTLGLVGESGCGKSVTSQAILRIVPRPGITSGRVHLFRGGNGATERVDIDSMDDEGEEIRAIRGKDIAMIFQEPMTCFSPYYTMGNQLMEAILLHRTPDKAAARELAVAMLKEVGIADPEKTIDGYPHEFSGGMRQRVMIAMALSCNPSLLIADEPTTALDVTIQAQVLELMKRLQAEFGMAILYITHDMGVIAEMCEEVAVMYLGKIVESAAAVPLFEEPLHPYTRGLLRSIPKIDARQRERLQSIEGVVPLPLDPPPRCGFCDRCVSAMPGLCDSFDVPMVEVKPRHSVRCFLYPEVVAARLPRAEA
ncbi:MAG: ABC transporter ATP-binding protein [Spirochaetes bacterium]|nr:ABC transporter ATP-binding protein [Spirochaetota bacterium]